MTIEISFNANNSSYLTSTRKKNRACELTLRETKRMSKSVHARVFHDLELLRCVLRCTIERQL